MLSLYFSQISFPPMLWLLLFAFFASRQLSIAAWLNLSLRFTDSFLALDRNQGKTTCRLLRQFNAKERFKVQRNLFGNLFDGQLFYFRDSLYNVPYIGGFG